MADADAVISASKLRDAETRWDSIEHLPLIYESASKRKALQLPTDLPTGTYCHYSYPSWMWGCTMDEYFPGSLSRQMHAVHLEWRQTSSLRIAWRTKASVFYGRRGRYSATPEPFKSLKCQRKMQPWQSMDIGGSGTVGKVPCTEHPMSRQIFWGTNHRSCSAWGV